MADKITPCIWYDLGQARLAAEFYVSLGLPDSRIDNIAMAPIDNPSTEQGVELVVEFTLAGRSFMGLNGGPNFPQTQAVSFQIVTEDQAETDRLWDAITGNGGAESMCGWCQDRWGISWQITPRMLMDLHRTATPAAAQAGFAAMMTMKKIDIATLQAAVDGAA